MGLMLQDLSFEQTDNEWQPVLIKNVRFYH